MKKVFAREELCINCHLCEVYCKTNHSKSKDVIKAHKAENPAPVSRVTVWGDKTASVAVNCRHCDDPACVKACITGAMTKDKKTHPERMETKKYCRFCKRHTMHKETK